MRNHFLPVLATLVALALPAQAATPDPDAAEAKSRQNVSAAANRIVGLWRVDVSIGPCGAAPNRFFSAFNTFHYGGTLSDFNFVPPSTRSPGHGIWEYMGAREYDTRFQFMRYLPTGELDGIQDVFGATVLDVRGNRYTSAVRARVLNVDGSLRVELCGNATGTRVTID
jgi:hypothetical protein